MIRRHVFVLLWSVVFCLCGCAVPTAGRGGGVVAGDFSLIHFTDAHINPHLLRTGEPGPVRGAETIRWICQQAGVPQELAPFGITAPTPSFALVTGDLTEYGVIDDSWEIFENAFRDLPCPMYVLPGNHDNTWVAMYHVMRRRHGGENYSFDKFGCRFVCISSASPQEPVPTVDAKTRAWLKADLESAPPGTPVFLALHHPLYSDEFANPAELETLLDLLRNYNVVLMLYGHGHRATHADIGGIDGIMGGSTFGNHAGYGILSVQDGVLRYAYRYHQGDPEAPDGEKKGPVWKPLLEKPLARTVPKRLFEIDVPREGFMCKTEVVVVDLGFSAPRESAAAEKAVVTVEVDGQGVEPAQQPSLSSDERYHRAFGIPIEGLTSGAHLLTAGVTMPDGTKDRRTRVFHIERPDTHVVWREQFPAAIKAGPVVVGHLLIAARNDGAVLALDKWTGQKRWEFATGGEILGTPAWTDDTIVFGSGDGKVYALDRDGKQRWVFDAGLPVYGWPLIDSGTVYIGDNGGRMHALNLADGKVRWTFTRADYAIESKPAIWKDMIVFGAWDGYLYALSRADGKLRWKSPGPKSSEGTAARYYAPADCGPIVVDGNLFACDRGYQLGMYSPEGALATQWPIKSSGIGPAPKGRSFFARTLDNRVCKLDKDGGVMWEVNVPAGRFPIAPTAQSGRVYVCSNRGLLSVLDAADGKLVWQYQATPGLYVMAPVTVDVAESDASPVCYVAGMDGSLTALRYRQNTRSTRQEQ